MYTCSRGAARLKSRNAAIARPKSIPKITVSIFGLRRTDDRSLEHAIVVARKQAALSKRILFLSRTQQVFNLWHVVHRPFSYAFAILALVHIGLALYMGYRL